MIDVAALRQQATNKYPEVIRAMLRGENPFPLALRYARIKTTDSRDAILRDIETLKGESRERLGHGITIDWEEINTVKYGRNRVPGKISLATEDDFLGYVKKAAEARTIRTAAEVLTESFPEVRPRLPDNWRLLRAGDREHWVHLCRVVAFFRDHPFPDRYIRELPIEVPTKFLEENYTTLETLLHQVAPDSIRQHEATFEERLGLKTPEALIECRLLDDTLCPEWLFRQFTVGLADLERLGHVPVHTVIITENRTNFLTLPMLPATIALQGQGYGVSRLERVPFLRDRRLIYWGDLDVQGFEILAVLRRTFPQVESVMMDESTWANFPSYRVNGVRSRNSPQVFLPHLRPAEVRLFEVIAASGMRLEQERVPQAYSIRALGQMVPMARGRADERTPDENPISGCD